MVEKIPKEIVDKINQRNKLNKEIEDWYKENIGIEDMSPNFADITDYHTGNGQGTDKCKEWCEQWYGEDWYYGHYYWETEYKGKYLHMGFET